MTAFGAPQDGLALEHRTVRITRTKEKNGGNIILLEQGPLHTEKSSGTQRRTQVRIPRSVVMQPKQWGGQ